MPWCMSIGNQHGQGVQNGRPTWAAGDQRANHPLGSCSRPPVAPQGTHWCQSGAPDPRVLIKETNVNSRSQTDSKRTESNGRLSQRPYALKIEQKG
jgi:hypothetical protein